MILSNFTYFKLIHIYLFWSGLKFHHIFHNLLLFLDKYVPDHLLLSCKAKFDKELVSLYKKEGVKIDFDVCIEFIKSQVSKSQCELFFALK
jgi:hypothetical protein